MHSRLPMAGPTNTNFIPYEDALTNLDLAVRIALMSNISPEQINAQVRQTMAGAGVAEQDGIEYDPSKRFIRQGQQRVYFSPAENRLIHLLVANSGKVVSYEDSVRYCNIDSKNAPIKVISPLISRIRKKTAKIPGSSRWIEVVRNEGCSFVAKVEITNTQMESVK